ncbi:MAG: 5'-methylthioadenosine/S-adenosylhomocysteine nucleosidase [Gammaproteobacteria bacterium]|nr:5'-methylthioadenosine/S-adenosylhomocysteine nucleosidase [Gammaproteobacteria bacterium]
MKKVIISLLFCILPCCVFAKAHYLNTGTLHNDHVDFALVVAMPSEATYMCHHYFNGCSNPTKIDHIKFYRGTVDHHAAVLVISGVGIVNSTLATTVMINQFHPHYSVFLGSSGGINPNLKVGDVIIGGKVFDYNFGNFSPRLGQPVYPKSQHSELIDPNNQQTMPLVYGVDYQQRSLLPIVDKVIKGYKTVPLSPQMVVHHQTYHPNVEMGTIADSSIFPTTNAETKIERRAHVDVVAFEDQAFLQTCWLYKRECLVIRSASNMLPFDKSNPSAVAQIAGMYAGKVAVKIFSQATES